MPGEHFYAHFFDVDQVGLSDLSLNTTDKTYFDSQHILFNYFTKITQKQVWNKTLKIGGVFFRSVRIHILNANFRQCLSHDLNLIQRS